MTTENFMAKKYIAVIDNEVSLIDEASVTIILCLHVLIAHHIFINFGYVDYFQ